MKKQIKAKWLKALKSGRYKRSQGHLKETVGNGGTDKFCCLGVLCDLYRKEHNIKTFDFEVLAKNRGDTMPNTRVLTWAGLHHDASGTLATKNDSIPPDDLTFKKVIPHIERYL